MIIMQKKRSAALYEHSAMSLYYQLVGKPRPAVSRLAVRKGLLQTADPEQLVVRRAECN